MRGFTALAVIAGLAVPAVGGTEDPKAASKELAEMYRVDQDDQNRWDELGDAEAGRRQRERRARAFEIVQKGLLTRPEDFDHAAWLFQHGDGVDDFLMAHLLASTAAFEGHEPAFFMSAAGLDRFLVVLDIEQRFGSQSFDAAGANLGDTPKLLSDVVVQIQAGLLQKPDDYYHAGGILVHATDRDDRLTAHVMATTAGLLEHKKARALYTRTLDRFLLSLGRMPVFTDQVPEGVELEPRDPVLDLHPKVRARIAGKKR